MNKKNTGFFSENKAIIIEWSFIASLISILFILVFKYSPLGFMQIIIEWNHMWEWATQWYGLFSIYWIEIIILIFIWDLLWIRLNRLVNAIYNDLTHKCIKKKWYLLKLVRFKYGYNKLSYHMRFGLIYIASSGNDRPELIDYIGKPTFSETMKAILSLLFNRVSILAGILTFLTFNDQLINTLQNTVINMWNESAVFLWDNFTKLSATVVVVLILFLGYFVSRRGIIRRAVAQANRKKLEEVVLKHRELSHYISDLISTGSKNIEYAINCYDLIVECYAYKIQPNASIPAQRRWVAQRYKESKDFYFENIPVLDAFIQEINVMKLAENSYVSRWFLKSKYEFTALFLFNSSALEIDQINRLLFTKMGFEEMNMPPEKFGRHSDSNFNEIDSETVKVETDEFKEYILESNIIEGTELIFKLYRYLIVLHKMINIDSDKFGRGLRALTNKE
ncbi:MAG: hypothetical protein ACE3L7_29200 [Candidatus Pristimantibacillus sp.]